MILKVVQKDGESDKYSHEMFVEADRFEIQFIPNQDAFSERDWMYTDQSTIPDGEIPVYCIRGWTAWPQEKFEVGYVVSGTMYLINDSGKTVDKYTI